MALRVQTVPQKPRYYIKLPEKGYTIGPLDSLEEATRERGRLYSGEFDWVGAAGGVMRYPKDGWIIERVTPFWTKVIEE